MKINAKDLASGIFLLVLAGLGLWLNMDHTLGNARRMGPGYMPMLVFWLELGLGAIVFVTSFFGGTDPLEKWTKIDFVTLALAIAAGLLGYQLLSTVPALSTNWYALGLSIVIAMFILAISPGWRVLATVLAGMSLFGVLLDAGGLFLSIAIMVVVAAFADKEHRPLGVAACVVFLIALCWWVFIHELDIRVNIWPTFF
ncbi:hypothetical protein EBE87_17880 [Pseudoroseomonas wenyumeiae]|uniref:Tripartite tricarboxylate transporter TctB family protein n=1 Tax=Teichococcus wenyumeiae TaxID=2478470 RepID=A0A3A9JKP8_9PROT|nr:hypothetical protein [Pseudoroseomonas wenyumeiae]RKK05135.1 hypothetical protein D6Z83_05675 [Pseudoroseomonas wenyumeiae]RMI20025.1 hypothetical protein EBE87_17880 [Pseudoroseomonas wenyumeiae]